MVAFWREKDLGKTLSLAGRLLRLPPTSFHQFSTSTLADGKMTKIYLLINTSQVSSRQLPSISGRRLYSDRHIECICQYIFGHIDTCCLSSPSSTSSPLPCHVTWNLTSPPQKMKNTYTHIYTQVFDPYKLKTQLLALHYSYPDIWQEHKRAQPLQSEMNLKQVNNIGGKRKTHFQINKTPSSDMCLDSCNFRGARDLDLNFAIWSSLQATSSIFFYQL